MAPVGMSSWSLLKQPVRFFVSTVLWLDICSFSGDKFSQRRSPLCYNFKSNIFLCKFRTGHPAKLLTALNKLAIQLKIKESIKLGGKAVIELRGC